MSFSQEYKKKFKKLKSKKFQILAADMVESLKKLAHDQWRVKNKTLVVPFFF